MSSSRVSPGHLSTVDDLIGPDLWSAEVIDDVAVLGDVAKRHARHKPLERYRNRFTDREMEDQYRARFLRQSRLLWATFSVSGLVQLILGTTAHLVPLPMQDFAIRNLCCGTAHLLLGQLLRWSARARSVFFASYWSMQLLSASAAAVPYALSQWPLVFQTEGAAGFLTAGYAWYASIASLAPQLSWRLSSEVNLLLQGFLFAWYCYCLRSIPVSRAYAGGGQGDGVTSLIMLCGTLLIFPTQIIAVLVLGRAHRKRFASHFTLQADLRSAEEKIKKQRFTALRTRIETLLACAHDLKTPVIAANHCLQQLQTTVARLVVLEHCPPALRDGAHLELHNMGDCIASALGSIENITTAVGAGKELGLLATRCRPREIVQRAVIACSKGAAGAAASSIRVIVRNTVPPEMLLAEHAVVRVLINLISNALKFTPSGGSINIVVSTRTPGDVCKSTVALHVAVHDTGCGVPDAEKEGIFDLHKRLHNESIPGLGVGLSSVLKLTRVLGGDCGVSDNRNSASQEVVGATFWFWLPVRVAVGSIPAQAWPPATAAAAAATAAAAAAFECGGGAAAEAGAMEESAVAAFKAEMCNTPDDILDTKLSSRSLGGSVTMLLQYLKQFVAKELPECMESIHAGQVDGDAARLHHVRPPIAANITASLPTLALTCSYTSTAPCLRTHLYHRSAARTRQHTL
jgi:signal transduction histidine kinase